MGAGPVSEAPVSGASDPSGLSDPSGPWGLSVAAWDDIQGIVYGGLASLPLARALFLKLTPTVKKPGSDRLVTGGGWLKRLREVAEITTGRPIVTPDMSVERAAAITFTASGLAALGIVDADLSTFARPFREGMTDPDRRRRLGDEQAGDLIWSGAEHKAPAAGPKPAVGARNAAASSRKQSKASTAEPPKEPAKEPPKELPKSLTVHALLLLYHSDRAALADWETKVGTALGKDAQIVHALDLDLRFETLPDGDRIAREHFGFADGLAQPVPHNDPAQRDRWNGVPVGEVLIGYENAHHEKAPGPAVTTHETAKTEKRAASGSDTGLDPAKHHLEQGHAAPGFRDIGLNGSYVVVRELSQDVAAFWTSLDAIAERWRATGEGNAITAQWIAERIFGRTRDGQVLRPDGVAAPDENDEGFGFFDDDRYGLGCPLGAHMRRANPRDGLAPTAGDKDTLLAAANSHRILRRARKYGPDIADPRKDDGQGRGLLFMCLNTDIVRQFEFVQQTWLLNPNFATLIAERDPLVGPAGPFTIPRRPLREIVQVETYVRLIAGEYFFLPSIKALDYLGAL